MNAGIFEVRLTDAAGTLSQSGWNETVRPGRSGQYSGVYARRTSRLDQRGDEPEGWKCQGVDGYTREWLD